MKHGFIKVAAITPKIKVADPIYNASVIIQELNKAYQKQAKIIVFPELCLTGYTCGDLFLQPLLLHEAEKELLRIVEATGEKVNILCANTKSVGGVGFGQMIVELPKEDEAIERVLKYIRENGVNFHEVQREEAKSV